MKPPALGPRVGASIAKIPATRVALVRAGHSNIRNTPEKTSGIRAPPQNPCTTLAGISDQIAPKPNDPALGVIEQWLPDQPYTFQRIGIDTTPADKLTVTPFQFRAVDTSKGWLRRFGQLVFEVTYADPRKASASILGDTIPPLVGNVTISPIATPGSIGTAAVHSVGVSATVSDSGGSGSDFHFE